MSFTYGECNPENQNSPCMLLLKNNYEGQRIMLVMKHLFRLHVHYNMSKPTMVLIGTLTTCRIYFKKLNLSLVPSSSPKNICSCIGRTIIIDKHIPVWVPRIIVKASRC